MEIFKRPKNIKGYTIIYLTPNSKYVLLLIFIISLVLSGVGYDYFNNKNKGDRFTESDGVSLHIFMENKLTQQKIDSIYGDKTTDFRNYIEEVVKK